MSRTRWGANGDGSKRAGREGTVIFARKTGHAQKTGQNYLIIVLTRFPPLRLCAADFIEEAMPSDVVDVARLRRTPENAASTPLLPNPGGSGYVRILT